MAGRNRFTAGGPYAPVLRNGFPFIFADTGGYLLRPFAGTLEFGRWAGQSAALAKAIPAAEVLNNAWNGARALLAA